MEDQDEESYWEWATRLRDQLRKSIEDALNDRVFFISKKGFMGLGLREYRTI